MHLLHLDSSARSTTDADSVLSSTRLLSAELVRAVVAADPSVQVTYRDLDAQPVPHVDQAWVDAAFGVRHDDPSAVALSEELVSELEAADLLVIGAPMYNYSVPASLKSWIDQVARVGRTFVHTPTGPQGLLTGKRAVVVRSSGSDPQMLAGYGLDFHTPYLRAILGFLGITDVHVVQSYGVSPDEVAAGLDSARDQIALLVPGLVDGRLVPAAS